MERPQTAPSRARPEHWVQVDALVRDIFGTVTVSTASTSSTSQPRRPYTACAGARAVGLVRDGQILRIQEDDEESDGGSLDPETPRQVGFAQVLTLEEPGRNEGEQPSPAALEAFERRRRAAKEATALQQLPPSQRLLQGFWSRPPKVSQAAQGQPQARAQAAQAAQVAQAAQSAQAAQAQLAPAQEKLPKSVMVGRAVGLRPASARLKSHGSWVNFLPLQKPLSSEREPQTDAGASSSMAAALQVAAPTAPAIDAVTPQDARVAESPPQEIQPLQDGCAEVSPKRVGPKFRVLPGKSRPADPKASIKVAAEKQEDFFVLEFRTEPRVVPARRHAFRSEEMAPVGAVGRKFKPLPRFRQDSRQWAVDREAHAARYR